MGSSTAMFDVPTGGVPQLRGVIPITEDDPDPQQMNWRRKLPRWSLDLHLRHPADR